MLYIALLPGIAAAAGFATMLLLSGRVKRALDKVCVLYAAILMASAAVFHAYYVAIGQPTLTVTLYRVPGIGGVYGFIVDPLSAFFALVVSLVSGLVMVYATGYMSPANNYHPVTSGYARYYAWMYLFIASVLFYIYSSTLLQMLVFFELMTLSCWGLITFYGTSETQRPGYKMLIATHLGAYAGLAGAIAYMVAAAGDTSLAALRGLDAYGKTVVAALVTWAALTKSSQFPTYSWLPDAMVAPTPTSALLHGATMIEMGPYLLARVYLSMGTVPLEAAYPAVAAASLSLLIAIVTYPRLRDAKRLLAYSTIAEAAAMYLFVAAYPLIGVAAIGLFTLYFTAHAFLKSTGFLLVGAAGYYLGTHDAGKVFPALRGDLFTWAAVNASLFGLVGVPVYSIAKIYCLVETGPALSSPLYAAAYAVFLAEAMAFLLVSMKWLSLPASRRVEAPASMTFSVAALLTLLYAAQAYCLAAALPAMGVM